MIIRLFDVISNHALKREHSFDIEVSRAGYEVFFVCVLSGQLISDKMAAVIQIIAINALILDGMPLFLW